jgi:predicted ester cyclase
VSYLEAPGQPPGPGGLKETLSWLRGLWGPLHADIEDEVCDGDKVVARVTMHGRLVGEFLGKPPTGKEFATEHIHIWRIRDGKVVEH